ncbi:MAG TPA: hypothetical protein VK249_24020 [Anaerolineales bacterium]|nr:hypothetical protein [Anaerolineales bacterium]
MQPEELVAAIALPAKEVGLPIEDELIAQIINDMKGEPGALPLMQFALKDLFDAQQAQGGLIALTLADYLRHGGIQKSLERHADASLASLDEKGQALARSIFSGLIEIGRGTQDTKRTALFDELVPANASTAEVLAIVQKLADARLIITDEQAGKDTVTISHEKLIEAWPWLKKLVDDNRDVIALQNEIASDAKEWEDHGRDPSYLYTGARLGLAQEQVTARKITLNGLAKRFIDEGIKVRDGERKARENLRRRIIVGLISGLAIALGLAGFAVFQMLQAQSQAKIARAGELTAQSISQRDRQFDLSILLSIEAYKASDTFRTKSVLLDNIQTNSHLLQYLQPGDPSCFLCNTQSIAFDKTGSVLAWANTNCAINKGCQADSIVILYNATKTFLKQQLPSDFILVNQLAFSPDGKNLALAGCKAVNTNCQSYEVIFWNISSSKVIGKPLDVDSSVSALSFSPDGKLLAVSSGHKITLWNIESSPHTTQSFAGDISTFHPIDKILAVGDRNGIIDFFDLATLKVVDQISTHKDRLYNLSFSPDGKLLIIKFEEGARDVIWDREKRQIIDPISEAPDITRDLSGVVLQANPAISPDGKILAYGANNRIVLWNIQMKTVIDQIEGGYTGWVRFFFFSPDSKLLVTINNDNSIVLWESDNRPLLVQRLTSRSGNSMTKLAVNPKNQTLAISDDNNIVLFDLLTQHQIGQPLSKHAGKITSLAFSSDGKVLASGSADHTIILWDMQTQQAIGQSLVGAPYPVDAIAFSQDGKNLISVSCPGTCSAMGIYLWDLRTYQMIGKSIINKFEPEQIFSWSVSNNGKWLVTSNFRGIFLWNLMRFEENMKPATTLDENATPMSFSADNKMLALSTCGAYSAAGNCSQIKISLFDIARGKIIEPPLVIDTIGTASSIAFSPDGKLVASVSTSGSVALWDLPSHQAIGSPIIDNGLYQFQTKNLVFSSNGKMLITNDNSGNILLWDIDSQSWVRMLCQRAGRNFTRAEWNLYFPNEKYRPTCPQWPLEPEPVTTPSPTSREPYVIFNLSMAIPILAMKLYIPHLRLKWSSVLV